MAFTVKDWRNATTHEGGGDESTPITAATIEDLEERVTDYAVLRTPSFPAADYATLQAAITAAGSAGGGRVMIAEVHEPTSTVTVPDGVSLVGEPGAVIRAAADMDYLIQNDDETNGNDNIEIRNLELDGNDNIRYNTISIQGTASSHVYVIGCHIHSTGTLVQGTGIHIENCSDVRVLDCEVNDTYRDGIQIWADCTNVQIRGNWVHETGDDCIALVGGTTSTTLATNCIVANNICAPLEPPTIAASGITIGPASQVVCSGNVIQGGSAGSAGIRLSPEDTAGVADVLVANNIVRESLGYGIAVGLVADADATGSITRVKVIGNAITDSYNDGIFVHSKTAGVGAVTDVMVNDNTILFVSGNSHDNGATGIWVYQESSVIAGVMIRGNKIEEAPSWGIKLQDPTARVDVVGNHVLNSGDQSEAGGILLSTAGDRFLIAENVCTDTGDPKTQTYGYQEQLGATQVRVVNNDFSGNLTGKITFGTGGVGTVASVAGEITLPDFPDVITLTGTNAVTSIVTQGQNGRQVTLINTSTAKLVDGSNLKLAGDGPDTADDSITIACDGTNWYEVARSVN